MRPFLVTARHVVDGHRQIVCRYNPLDSDVEGKRYLLDEEGYPFFHPNDKVDIAIYPIDQERLQDDGMDVTTITESDIGDIDYLRRCATEGDDLFVLGFPLDLEGHFRNNVVVRKGCISSLQLALDEYRRNILIDAHVYPGNSGGPVIIAPQAISIDPSRRVEEARVIGVVESYVMHGEHKENSGLTEVVPIHRVLETIEHLYCKRPHLRYVRAIPSTSRSDSARSEVQ